MHSDGIEKHPVLVVIILKLLNFLNELQLSVQLPFSEPTDFEISSKAS
jgi:hypothetical protein